MQPKGDNEEEEKQLEADHMYKIDQHLDNSEFDLLQFFESLSYSPDQIQRIMSDNEKILVGLNPLEKKQRIQEIMNGAKPNFLSFNEIKAVNDFGLIKLGENNYEIEEEKNLVENVYIPIGYRLQQNFVRQNRKKSLPIVSETKCIEPIGVNEKDDEIEIQEVVLSSQIKQNFKMRQHKSSKIEEHQKQSVSRSMKRILQKIIQKIERRKIAKYQQCLICLDEINENQFKSLSNCGHRFCENCIVNFLDDCINNSKVLNITCPLEGCIEEYTEDVIKSNVSDVMFQKYLKFKKIKLITSNPNNFLCPKEGCLGFVQKTLTQTKLICECGQNICGKCGKEFHENITCTVCDQHQSIKKQATDQSYLKAQIEFMIYKCPRCLSPIQKSTGCNHMTCSSCNYQFCWVCRSAYTPGHYIIWNFCGCISINMNLIQLKVPGAQFMDLKPFKNPTLWKLLMVIPRLILIILTLVILPIALILFMISQPYNVWYKRRGKYWLQNKHSVISILVFIGFILLGIILLPFFLMKNIIILSQLIYLNFCRECCKECKSKCCRR